MIMRLLLRGLKKARRLDGGRSKDSQTIMVKGFPSPGGITVSDGRQMILITELPKTSWMIRQVFYIHH